MKKTFDELLRMLREAAKPGDVFGVLPTDGGAALKRRYHELVLVVHPDHNAGQRDEAVEAFRRLQHWYDVARQQPRTMNDGSRGSFTITIGRQRYEARASSLQGDVCDLFEAKTGNGDVLLKITRQPRNNDLLRAEASALRRIDRELADQAVRAHFPRMVDTFVINDEAGTSRQVNVLNLEHEYVTLAQVIRAYPHGVEPADAGWIFNRILAAVGTAHNLGIVHGAVIPSHVLLRPGDHNGMLVDWCYSVDNGMSIKAVSPPYRVDYPSEVLAQEPAGFATDLFMAARCVVRLLGGAGPDARLPAHVPRAMEALLRACLIPSPHRRYQDAWQVFDDWREILQSLYGPPRFRPFNMPSTA